jgi:hypothetical protein
VDGYGVLRYARERGREGEGGERRGGGRGRAGEGGEGWVAQGSADLRADGKSLKSPYSGLQPSAYLNPSIRGPWPRFLYGSRGGGGDRRVNRRRTGRK